ncbi:MAG: ABC transporter ATP-binding protein, partial [Inhella sp.]
MPASLGALLRQFIGQHRGAYAAAAAMLLVIALLQVWMPRHVGRVVDGLVAGQWQGATLWQPLG